MDKNSFQRAKYQVNFRMFFDFLNLPKKPTKNIRHISAQDSKKWSKLIDNQNGRKITFLEARYIQQGASMMWYFLQLGQNTRWQHSQIFTS